MCTYSAVFFQTLSLSCYGSTNVNAIVTIIIINFCIFFSTSTQSGDNLLM